MTRSIAVRPVRFARLSATACALATLLAASHASAQPASQPRRIGFLGMDAAMQATRFAAFRDEMRRQGFVDGENIVIEARWADGRFDRLPALAADLVAAKVEVLVTAAPPAVRAAMGATTTTPVVAISHEPVAMGFASSLARPGGRFTGVAFQDSELSIKRLELMRAVIPGLRRLAIVWNREGGGDAAVTSVERAASVADIETRAFEIRGPADLTAAVASAKAWGAQAVLQLASPVITFHRKVLIEALASHRLPASCELRLYVQEGCLMTYSADLDEMFRMMARPTARILKGTKAADLPIEQPTKFDFVINMTTAESLGLNLSPVVRLQVTDVVR